MQNNTITKKWTDIERLAAVTINTGKKVGTIEDFYFDSATSIVSAFVIKTGMFSHRILLAKDINSLGVDALTFANEDILIKEGSQNALQSAIPGRSLLHYKVLSEGGTVIGSIGNVILDLATPTLIHVVEFELAGGLRENITNRYMSFPTDQVIRYGADVIVLSDTAAEKFK